MEGRKRQRRMKGYHYVYTDATLADNDLSSRGNLAAIAGIEEQREVRLLFMDIVRVASSAEAELMALVRGMEIAEKQRYGRVVFRSDSEGTVKVVQGKRSQARLVREARAYLKNNPSWILEVCERSWNTAAHVQCKNAFRIYQAGVEGTTTIR